MQQSYHLPRECYRRADPGDCTLQFASERPIVFALDRLNTDDEPVGVDMPVGATRLVCVGRICGDYYADIEGDGFHIAAIGKTPKSAVQAAAAKAASK